MAKSDAADTIVRYEVSNNIARITLHRPPVNALSVPMIRTVVAAFQRAAADQMVRAVVLSSAVAKRFSAGLDIDILLGKPGEEIRKFVQELYINLYDAQIQSRKAVDRRGRRRGPRRRNDNGGLLRRGAGRRERHLRVSGDRRRRHSLHSLCASAEDRRPPPGV